MRLAWESQGDGKPVLLVHGLGYTRAGWGPVRERLARRYRVVSFDNRGIGESEKPPGPYDVPTMTQDAVQVMDEAGLDRAHVVGASLGGMIAQTLAVQHPERVEKLVLACTTPGVADAYPMPQVTVDLFSRAATMEPHAALRAFVENSLGAEPPDGIADEIYAYRVANPPDMAGWQAQVTAGTTFPGVDVARITAPTLVVTGTVDNVIDPRNSELLATRIPNARLERVDGGGHMFIWERADEFATLVEEFLA
jgi:pimeloyl-ACP methyl ester carboxylesterase